MGNNNTYPIIDEYIKSLYKGDKSKEVTELKEELREHLILSADEFSSKGYDAEKSEKMAIEKFDGGTDMLKELHSSLQIHKLRLKNITKVVGLIAIISFILVLSLISYTEINDKKAMTLSNQMDKKLELFTKQNDITTINNIGEKIQNLLDKKLVDLEIRVADMEDGNTEIDVDKNLFELVYDNFDDKLYYHNSGGKSFFEENENQNLVSYGGQSFLDKKGNVVHYQFFANDYGYNRDIVDGLIKLFICIGIISLSSYLILKFQLIRDKKRTCR
ncbi:hypothetical protein J0L31_11220 [Terrisporobacter glycolicus]|nr:hypothetical protein [Terrisporobacter glycolicus]